MTKQIFILLFLLLFFVSSRDEEKLLLSTKRTFSSLSPNDIKATEEKKSSLIIPSLKLKIQNTTTSTTTKIYDKKTKISRKKCFIKLINDKQNKVEKIKGDGNNKSVWKRGKNWKLLKLTLEGDRKNYSIYS